MAKKSFIIGDGTKVVSPPVVDASKLGFFDELEYECWKLFQQYCKKMNITIVDASFGNDIDFFIAKEIQEKVLSIFEKDGITINYGGDA